MAGLIQQPARVAEVAKHLASQPIVAFDTEFVRERTFFPQLGLIQLADRQQGWLMDPLALSQKDVEPLFKVLTDSKVLKVAHAVEQDQECLYHTYRIVASPVLDTAVAAALTGRGDQIGLSALLQKLLGLRLPKGHTRTNWLKRPLPAAMLAYALADVQHLVAAAEILLADLDQRGRRDWALDVSARSADTRQHEADSGAIAWRLAAGSRLNAGEYAVLRELVRWREERVRKLNVPRRWVADDQVLVKLAHAHPTEREELAQFRGLHLGKRGDGAGRVLTAIRKGLATPPEQLLPPPPRPEPDPEEVPALALLKCFMGLLAHQHDVPARLLVEPNNLLSLLRQRSATVEELQRSGLLSRAAVDLFGEELIAILQGKQVLKLKDGRVQRYGTPSPE